MDDFLDEDEKQEVAKSAVAVAPEFDTFGASAAARARDAAEAEAAARSEVLPGLLPADLLEPIAESLGETWASQRWLPALALLNSNTSWHQTSQPASSSAAPLDTGPAYWTFLHVLDLMRWQLSCQVS